MGRAAMISPSRIMHLLLLHQRDDKTATEVSGLGGFNLLGRHQRHTLGAASAAPKRKPQAQQTSGSKWGILPYRTTTRPDIVLDHLSATARLPSAASCPAAMDWRQRPGVLRPVRDMGMCGASWAYAATAAIEAAAAIATGVSHELSVQQMIDCNSEGCLDDACTCRSGGYSEAAMASAAAIGGMSREADYPKQCEVEGTLSQCPSTPLQCHHDKSYSGVRPPLYFQVQGIAEVNRTEETLRLVS